MRRFCAVRHDEHKNRTRRALFRRVAIAYFNHRDGRNRDDGGGDGDNGDGGAGIAAALPRSETYSRGGDDGGGDIVPVARFHLLTARRLIHQSLAVAN
jgi:hypothetical protein